MSKKKRTLDQYRQSKEYRENPWQLYGSPHIGSEGEITPAAAARRAADPGCIAAASPAHDPGNCRVADDTHAAIGRDLDNATGRVGRPVRVPDQEL